ncbi:MAG TPA: sigma-70 family RNA polymerase sigma factor [Acidimicrobiales bacterium]|nr:sigma-70 family RNA polymerase sigma factor [Acidimicrobiales bacterium]
MRGTVVTVDQALDRGTSRPESAEQVSADQVGPATAGREPAGAGRVARGERLAAETFGTFYRSQYHAVVALAYALTGKAAVAEELAQDAFLVAYRNWGRISGYEVPGAYVRRVVTNMSVSFSRRIGAQARALARLASRTPTWTAPLEQPDADFWRSVRSLPPRQAQVLVLRYLEDRSSAEIAHILGCSEATVRVHLHNGRLSLASRLGIETNERSSA